MVVDLASFRKAIASLERGLARAESALDDEEVRDGAIQRFECTYELAWKSLKRVLENMAASPDEIDALSFRDLIRHGAEKGLIDDPAAWFGFREERNISSHTYDEAKAKEVYRAALSFAPQARILLERLEDRLR